MTSNVQYDVPTPTPLYSLPLEMNAPIVKDEFVLRATLPRPKSGISGAGIRRTLLLVISPSFSTLGRLLSLLPRRLFEYRKQRSF
jgi:hypothetical protein